VRQTSQAAVCISTFIFTEILVLRTPVKWSYWDLWQATPFMTIKQTTPYAVNYRQNAYWTRQMNTDVTGFYICKVCHQTESLLNHITTDQKEGEQLEDRRNVGESSFNSGDGTDQRVQYLMFMMIMMRTPAVPDDSKFVVRFPVKAIDCFPHQSVWADPNVHPDSYSTSIWSSVKGKATGGRKVTIYIQSRS
jgi:hypothetical protein